VDDEDFDLIDTTAVGAASVEATKKRKNGNVVVTNVQELREAILCQGSQLSEIDLQIDYSLPLNEHTNSNSSTDANNATPDSGNNNKNCHPLLRHDVLRLISNRYHSKSKPNLRHPNDSNKLALAIEGGGMRGAVSAGMTAALASLGLADTIDIVYGSSAGSVIAAYLLSDQMCIDIYTDLLPDAKSHFVCKKRLISSLLATAIRHLKNKTFNTLQQAQLENNNVTGTVSTEISHGNYCNGENEASLQFLSSIANKPASWASTASSTSPNSATAIAAAGQTSGVTTGKPGMNISFILDEIMCPQKGLRPFDIKTFYQRHKVQPLRVVSSVVRTADGVMDTIAFGSQEGDFFSSSFCTSTAVSNHLDINGNSMSKQPRRSGFFACLEAAMTVPGACGAPKNILRLNGNDMKEDYACFDSFVFEPIPYRSAVEEGATHVLVFRSRPYGCRMGTKPGLYEKIVAPMYFRSHGLPHVGNYVKNGGQQYRYIEDVLTLQEGYKAGLAHKSNGDDNGLIPVPPTKVLYGIDADDVSSADTDVTQWKRAHLFPIVTPKETSELQTLDQGKKNVIDAVKSGYAAAFDALAPIVGINLDSKMNGMRVAELLFPFVNGKMQRNNKLIDLILSTASRDEASYVKNLDKIKNLDEKQHHRSIPLPDDSSIVGTPIPYISDVREHRDVVSLLSILPGLQSGKFKGLVDRVNMSSFV